MKVAIGITGHLVDPDGNGVDMSSEQIEELAGELEGVIEDYFRRTPWATEEHNKVLLVQVEAGSQTELFLHPPGDFNLHPNDAEGGPVDPGPPVDECPRCRGKLDEAHNLCLHCRLQLKKDGLCTKCGERLLPHREGALYCNECS